MPLVQSPTILACVVIYLLVCFAIGIWAMRRTRNSEDFYIAAKSLGPTVILFATMSSVMSGFGFVGGPGLVFESGSTSLWMTFAATFGFPLSWLMLGKRLRLLNETRQVLTLPDAVAARYGGAAPRLAMAAAILLGVLGYLGTQILAIGMVLSAVTSLPLLPALAIGLGVLLFYSVAGGIIAGVYTDLFQGAIMLLAAVAVLYYALHAGGGVSAISVVLWRMDPEFIGPWGTRGPVTALSWWLLFALGWAAQPHSITKFLMLRDANDLRWGALLAGPAYAVLSLLWMSIGLVMRALVERGLHPPLESPDQAAPLFLLHFTPELLSGIVFAGLLAAVMSTADSFVNLGAAAVVHDIPKGLWGRPLRRELLWSRIATGALLVFSALFALYMENLIALLGTFGWGTFAAAIFPSLAIGLNWKRATAAACVSSIMASIVLNFSLELAARHGIYELPHGFAAGCFSMLAAIVVFVGVSWFSRTPSEPLAPDVEAVMEI